MKRVNGLSAVVQPLTILVLALFATGCVQHAQQPQYPSTSPPAEEQDRGPDREVDLSDVLEPEPRRENVTMAGNRSPYTVLGHTYHINYDTKGFSETGYASWYGKKFHGRRTSNGEIYDMYAMTAAHKTLPIPCYVRVTNLENQREVVVRVNDRGPFHDGRIIDLSYAAAQRLDMHRQGTARVRVDIIEAERNPELDNGLRTFLQAGAFSREDGASNLRGQLQSLTHHPVSVRLEPKLNVYRVLIGPIDDSVEMMTLQRKIVEHNLADPRIVEM